MNNQAELCMKVEYHLTRTALLYILKGGVVYPGVKDPCVSELNLSAIGDRIRGRRAEKHWTQQELAERCDLSQRTIASFEGGSHAMTIVALDKIAEILDLSIMYLLYGNHVGGQYP